MNIPGHSSVTITIKVELREWVTEEAGLRYLHGVCPKKSEQIQVVQANAENAHHELGPSGGDRDLCRLARNVWNVYHASLGARERAAAFV